MYGCQKLREHTKLMETFFLFQMFKILSSEYLFNVLLFFRILIYENYTVWNLSLACIDPSLFYCANNLTFLQLINGKLVNLIIIINITIVISTRVRRLKSAATKCVVRYFFLSKPITLVQWSDSLYLQRASYLIALKIKQFQVHLKILPYPITKQK